MFLEARMHIYDLKGTSKFPAAFRPLLSPHLSYMCSLPFHLVPGRAEARREGEETPKVVVGPAWQHPILLKSSFVSKQWKRFPQAAISGRCCRGGSCASF